MVLNVIIGVLLGLVTGIIQLPVLLRVAKEKKLYDIPDERKVHDYGIPRIGGFAFVPSLLFSVLLVFGIEGFFPSLFQQYDIEIGYQTISDLKPLVVCAVLGIYLVGVTDDLVDVSYRIKFVAQLGSAILICMSGFYLRDFFGLFYLGSLSPLLGYALTAILIIYIINAINLADGVDGLSSVLSGLSFIYYGAYAFLINEPIPVLITSILLGTLAPFYYYNVFGTPHKHSKIFMGDTGSQTIGLLLSTFALYVCHKGAMKMPLEGVNPLAAAFVPLILPGLDVLRVFGYRIFRGHNPFIGDRNHLHHKLLSAGASKFGVSLFFLIYTIVVGGGTIYLSRTINVTWLLSGNIILYLLVILYLNHRIIRRT